MSTWERIRDLSDDQRRWFCRWGFVSFGIVPILLLGWWIAASEGLRDWEQRCEAALGLSTEIGELTTLGAGRVRLTQVELSDPELGWVVRIGELELSQQGERWSAVADRVELRTSTAAAAWQRLRKIFDLPAATLPEFEVAVRGVTAVSDQTDQALPSWDRMVWTRQASPDRVVLLGQLTPAGSQNLPPMQLQIERRRDEEPTASLPTTSLYAMLDTRDQTLSLAWLRAFYPVGLTWGEECEFNGLAILSLDARNQLSCDLSGRIDQIDLQRAVADQFRHVLQGKAQLVLTRCVVREQRIQELAGRLESAHGVIGLPLVRSLAKSLILGTSDTVAERGNSSEAIGYQQLLVRFDMDGAGLVVNGNEQQVLVYDALGSPLLHTYSSYPLSPLDLVRGLVPDSRVQVPLTPETATLMNWLPLPDAASLVPEATGEPRGVLRMEE